MLSRLHILQLKDIRSTFSHRYDVMFCLNCCKVVSNKPYKTIREIVSEKTYNVLIKFMDCNVRMIYEATYSHLLYSFYVGKRTFHPIAFWIKGIMVKIKNLINFVFKILRESLIATLCRNVLQNTKPDMKEGCISRCYKLKVAFNNSSPFVKHMIHFIKQYLIQTFLKKFFAHSHEFRKYWIFDKDKMARKFILELKCS